MNDATCPKCGKRFGWAGEVVDRPPCPNCSHTIPLEILRSDQKMLDEVRKMLLEN